MHSPQNSKRSHSETSIDLHTALFSDSSFDEDISDINAVFPDCDSAFILMKLKSFDSPNRKLLVVEFLLNNPYPKTSCTNAQAKTTTTTTDDSNRRALLESLTPANVIEKFIDPVSYFQRKKRPVDSTYREHVYVYLCNALPKASRSHIRKTMQENNNLLLHSLESIKADLDFINCSYHSTLVADHMDYHETNAKRQKLEDALKKYSSSKAVMKYPDPPSDYFYYELTFIQCKLDVDEILQEKEKVRASMRENCSSLLAECSICLLTDCLTEEMYICSLCFGQCCKCCLRSYIEARAECGDFSFHCIFNECNKRLDDNIIALFVPESSYILSQLQLRNVNEAQLHNLEFCPLCGFGMVIDDERTRIFSCKNPRCMKDTCRLCKEASHLPLRCDEIEKDCDKEFRIFIEKRISESIIRFCPKCKTRFYKTEGCDLVVCAACGQSICYCCRKAVDGYEHFSGNMSCVTYGDTTDRHLQEMKHAYEKAVKEYKEKHPEYNPTLSYDDFLGDTNI